MDDITRIFSVEGEELKIRRVKAVGVPVEKWISQLYESMVVGVKKSIKEAHQAYREESQDFRRHIWVREDFTAQAIQLVASIIWCLNTE